MGYERMRAGAPVCVRYTGLKDLQSRGGKEARETNNNN